MAHNHLATTPTSPIKAFYTFSELGNLVGRSRWAIRKWVQRKTVRTEMIGGVTVVSLVAFRDAYPDIWDSILEVHGVGVSAIECPSCGAELEI